MANNKQTELFVQCLPADLETPVSAYLKLCHDEPYATLLESVEGGTNRGRYSAIALKPDWVWKVENQKSSINTSPLNSDVFEPTSLPPLESLREKLKSCRFEMPSTLPPMSDGVLGYLGYDIVREIEHLPSTKPNKMGIPQAMMMHPTLMVIFDNVKDEIYVISPYSFATEHEKQTNLSLAQQKVTEAIKKLHAPLPVLQSTKPAQLNQASNTTNAQYIDMVEKAKEYIRAGDIFQVVLSQRFEADFAADPFEFYRHLRRINPAPYLVYLKWPTFSLACSSPETLVRLREGKLTIRPIAGTRKRGKTPAEDLALEVELQADPKENAEHLMLLDLGRNDVGKVAKLGSVIVTDQFKIEKYSRVMHIVSNVEGQLAPQYDALDALLAGFPAGTVSGAPKVRAMQIIDELEIDARGSYAGAVCYFGASGDMDSCIALRTAMLKDNKIYVQAGAGIVADSNPQAEYEECQHKASALFLAAQKTIQN